MRNYVFILLFLFFQVSDGQKKTNQLKDSLNFTSDPLQRVQLSKKIASAF